MDMKTSPLALLKDPTLLKTDALINGEWVKGASRFDVHDPSNGNKLADVANLGPKEAEAAIAAANAAWPAWRNKTGKERSIILRNWFNLLMANQEDLGRLMTAEQGKPFAEAKGEVAYGASFVEWYAEEAKRVDGETLTPFDMNRRLLVIRQPIGVCAAITPWNFPLAMITRKVAPALAAGCPVVIKPAELTPLTALAVAELAMRAGIPAGVLNLLTADGPNSIAVGKVFCASDTVRHISFTGSTEVGRILMAQSAPSIKKLSLELGGNAPFIVFDDADLDSAVEGAMASKYRNAGQTCVCANRIYVQEGVYDEFVKKFSAKVGALKVGNGFEDGVVQGPLIEDAAVEKVRAPCGRRAGQGRQGGGRRQEAAGPVLPADGDCGRDRQHAVRQGRDLRPGGADLQVQDRAGSDRGRQQHRVRPGQLLLQPRRGPHLPRRRGAGIRHGRHQRRHHRHRARALRRRQAVGPGPRRLEPRHGRVPGDEVPVPGRRAQVNR